MLILFLNMAEILELPGALPPGPAKGLAARPRLHDKQVKDGATLPIFFFFFFFFCEIYFCHIT